MKRVLAFFLLSFSLFSQATTLDRFIVFGDSLSDNGNLYEYMKHQLPLSPPYYQGRFTNGPVWVEYLNAKFYPEETLPHAQTHLLDYAFGGAGVSERPEDNEEDALFTLSREVDGYLLAHQDQADPNALFVVWIGANNYIAMPDDPDAAVQEVNEGIQHTLERLVKKGARHFLVVNLPDLGITPAARDFDLMDSMSHMSGEHNKLLKNNIEQLKVTYPNVQWMLFDVNQVLHEIIDNPATYGFTNVTDTCYEEVMDAAASNNKGILNMVSTVTPHKKPNACQGYFFFDPVHPSGPAHLIMAERMKQLLDDMGITFH